MDPGDLQPLLTLEPLIDAVREGVEMDGWEISGLQKTTSQEFAGRWAGDTTRSAYLFFHQGSGPDRVSVEAFLDETNEGLQGNLALVVDACALDQLGDVPAALGVAGRLAARHLPRGHRTPVTLRLRLEEGVHPPGRATTEFRFKLVLPERSLREGAASVARLASDTARAFRKILADPDLARYLEP